MGLAMSHGTHIAHETCTTHTTHSTRNHIAHNTPSAHNIHKTTLSTADPHNTRHTQHSVATVLCDNAMRCFWRWCCRWCYISAVLRFCVCVTRVLVNWCVCVSVFCVLVCVTRMLVRMCVCSCLRAWIVHQGTDNGSSNMCMNNIRVFVVTCSCVGVISWDTSDMLVVMHSDPTERKSTSAQQHETRQRNREMCGTDDPRFHYIPIHERKLCTLSVVCLCELLVLAIAMSSVTCSPRVKAWHIDQHVEHVRPS